MRRHRPNLRRIKTHLPYTVEEAAKALGIHPNTFRSWIANGLTVADDRRPVIVAGEAIRAYLEEKQSKRSAPLRPGQLFCFRCKGPRYPAENMADFEATDNGLGTLCALCSDCGTLMYRRTSQAKLFMAMGKLDVKILPGRGEPKREMPSPLKL